MATSLLYLHEHLLRVHYNPKSRWTWRKKLVINKAICWLNQHVVNFNDGWSLIGLQANVYADLLIGHRKKKPMWFVLVWLWQSHHISKWRAKSTPLEKQQAVSWWRHKYHDHCCLTSCVLWNRRLLCYEFMKACCLLTTVAQIWMSEICGNM